MECKMPVENGIFLYDNFPKGFLFGMGTAAYQCEGGFNEHGKGVNIWDTFVREHPEKILDQTTGDIALDSYHQYKQDVQMLKSIGANVYRFSLSWSRILPTGRTDKINQPGVDYYNSLINELIANGIQPMVTLYHWDLPQDLQTVGGWLSEEIVQLFGDYARLCFKLFGDRVKKWTTLNEPYISGMMGYYFASFAPGIHEPLEAPYTYMHHQLMAHAQAFRIYEAEFKSEFGGVIGISCDTSCYLPFNKDNPEDVEAADRSFQFRLGWLLEPLFHGRYPKVMRDLIDKRSKDEGRAKSRLPEFTSEWAENIKGSIDFIGLNYYNAELVKGNSDGEVSKDWALDTPFFNTNLPGWNQDLGTFRSHDPSWPRCGASWQNFAPCGIRECIRWISDNYGKPEIIVTETGCSGVDGRLEDEQRTEHFKLSLNSILKAIKEDGNNVTGYVGWSLLDVWEWESGHTINFGIVHVDRTSPDFKRTSKDSAKYLESVFRNNGFLPEKPSLFVL